jgi:hypothetical protein
LNASIDTKDQSKSSHFHKQRFFQILEKSAESIRRDSIEERNHTAVTLCLDPAQIPLAKEKIRTFIWSLSRLLEGDRPSRVAELSIQLFPLEAKP